MGYASDLGDGHIRAPKDLIQRLEAADVERAGKALAAERGCNGGLLFPATMSPASLSARPSFPAAGSRMIDDGLGFSLVPWRPVLDKRIGQHISGIAMPGGGVDWSFARKRGLGL